MRKNNLIPIRLKEEMKYLNIPMTVWVTIPSVLMTGFYVFPLFLPKVTSIAYVLFIEIFVIYMFIPYHKKKNYEIVLDYLSYIIRRKIYKW